MFSLSFLFNLPANQPANKKRLFQWTCWLLPLCFFSLSGCVTLKSRSSQVVDKDEGRAVSGMHYFLPKANIQITGTLGAKNASYVLQIERVMEADREQRYRLRPTRSVFHDDVHTFEVNGKGLIKTAGVTATNQVETIVLNLTNTVIQLGQIATKASKFAADVQGEDIATKLKPFKVVYDPYDAGEIEEARRIVQRSGFVLEAELLHRLHKTPAAGARRDPWTHEEAASESGIYYRPCTTARVTLRMQEQLGNLMRSTDVPVPDRDDVSVFRLGRGVFATKTETLAFEDGEIRSMNSTRPSEAVAFTKIPLTVTTRALGALNEAPALGQFLWRPEPAANADIKAQTERLKAENERLKAEKALRDQAAANQKLQGQL